MKKTLPLFLILMTSLFSANAEEITIWEGSYSANLIFDSSHNSANYSTLVANLVAGDKIKFYYSGASESAEILLQSNWDDIRNSAVLDYEADSYSFTVTPTMVSKIASTGLMLRPTNSTTITLTKVSVVKVPEITIWENAEGLAGNLVFGLESSNLNTLIEFIRVGDVITIYYTGAYSTYDPSGSAGRYCYHELYIQTADMMTDYGESIIGKYTTKLITNEGFKDFFVTQNFIDNITANGLALHRGGWASFKFTKVTVKKAASKVPGYESLYNSSEPFEIAWGKTTSPASKRHLLNLKSGDLIHVDWAVNSTWDSKGWIPNNIVLVTSYQATDSYAITNASSAKLKQSISKSDVEKSKEFTLDDTSIEQILSCDLNFSGYYYDLVRAYVVHPDRCTSVTTNSDGLATFGHTTEAIDCSWFESLGLKAYTASISGDRIVTTKVTEAVPAGTGLILQGTPSTTYKLPFAASASAIADNELVPTTGSAITGYVLAKHSTLGVGFFKVTDKVVAAGKAYIPATTSARYFSLDFLEDETTDIRNTPPHPAFYDS